MPTDKTSLEDAIASLRAGTLSSQWRPSLAPAYVYLLADNLDAALAAGEDLTTSSFYWLAANRPAPRGEGSEDRLEARAAVDHIRTLEITLVARVLKSRERAEDLARRDDRFKSMAKLYISGTAVLVEAVAEFGDTTLADFETGDGLVSYLRTRGLIAAEAPAPAEGTRIAITDGFRIAQRIPLGSLMDLVAMFLDTLETHYELYVEDEALRPGTRSLVIGPADPEPGLPLTLDPESGSREPQHDGLQSPPPLPAGRGAAAD